MIIIGYPGIGKTSLSCQYYNYIDLESSCIQTKEGRPSNWDEIYCNIAEELSRQDFNVFISSHETVRNRLKESMEEVVVCYPSLLLRDSWIERLKQRFINSGLDKDYRAMRHVECCYTKDIKELMTCGFPCIEIKSMDYNLDFELDSFLRHYMVPKDKDKEDVLV